jgi:hypothetical protein
MHVSIRSDIFSWYDITSVFRAHLIPFHQIMHKGVHTLSSGMKFFFGIQTRNIFRRKEIMNLKSFLVLECAKRLSRLA